jgi:hypothetical protein
VGVVEWVASHFAAPFVNLYGAFASRRRPQLKIYELVPTGGGTDVDFNLVLHNVGDQPRRYTVTARVGDTPVRVKDSPVDLLANLPPTTVRIRVPRTALGDRQGVQQRGVHFPSLPSQETAAAQGSFCDESGDAA